MENRLKKNLSGDFYTTGECLACGLPEDQAPTLFAPLSDNNHDTYFVRQPVTPEEVLQAIAATEVCCAQAVRYGGKDKDIIRKMNPRVTDFVLDVDENIVENIETESPIPKMKRWWQFWKKT